MGVATASAGPNDGRLKKNAIGLPSAMAMSLAFISPTIGVIFISALIANQAGTKAAYDAWAPIGRMATPRERAYVALFLAPDESAFVVGSTFLADGGFTASI